MLKSGIFLDIENLSHNGGWGMRFDVIKALAKAQGTEVLRANAYMAADRKREREDVDYRERANAYRDATPGDGNAGPYHRSESNYYAGANGRSANRCANSNCHHYAGAH